MKIVKYNKEKLKLTIFGYKFLLTKKQDLELLKRLFSRLISDYNLDNISVEDSFIEHLYGNTISDASMRIIELLKNNIDDKLNLKDEKMAKNPKKLCEKLFELSEKLILKIEEQKKQDINFLQTLKTEITNILVGHNTSDDATSVSDTMVSDSFRLTSETVRDESDEYDEDQEEISRSDISSDSEYQEIVSSKNLKEINREMNKIHNVMKDISRYLSSIIATFREISNGSSYILDDHDKLRSIADKSNTGDFYPFIFCSQKLIISFLELLINYSKLLSDIVKDMVIDEKLETSSLGKRIEILEKNLSSIKNRFLKEKIIISEDILESFQELTYFTPEKAIGHLFEFEINQSELENIEKLCKTIQNCFGEDIKKAVDFNQLSQIGIRKIISQNETKALEAIKSIEYEKNILYDIIALVEGILENFESQLDKYQIESYEALRTEFQDYLDMFFNFLPVKKEDSFLSVFSNIFANKYKHEHEFSDTLIIAVVLYIIKSNYKLFIAEKTELLRSLKAQEEQFDKYLTKISEEISKERKSSTGSNLEKIVDQTISKLANANENFSSKKDLSQNIQTILKDLLISIQITDSDYSTSLSQEKQKYLDLRNKIEEFIDRNKGSLNYIFIGFLKKYLNNVNQELLMLKDPVSAIGNYQNINKFLETVIEEMEKPNRSSRLIWR
ncbi:MAG: hypothetical protein K9W46_04500 [Candidatus Heimdallarchaeum endolithica]|uniref:Uncharacterized protein n=1 Tax=Candidatus Heimdallarchaeum endolithica TaxID=2876572 RepID=A0A9Y1FQ62_9ARCH|nr:MAG: hypothetical protein K9W46_04500 [Candidatus Heimdallarchaeum endolithica]